MKRKFWLYPFIAIGFVLILTNGCKKDDDKNIQFNPDLSYETMTDIDGNVYRTIKIGTQTWMAENLKVTKYRNGDSIPNVTNGRQWIVLTTGAYCEYGNNASNSAVYGKLYNRYAVADSRNIAPTGWHVASDAEWTTLTTFLGGVEVAGGKLKEKGTSHWQSPNEGATNETGFSALPGGACSASSYNLGLSGMWWSFTASSTEKRYWDMSYDNGEVMSGGGSINRSSGLSVRCVRD